MHHFSWGRHCAWHHPCAPIYTRRMTCKVTPPAEQVHGMAYCCGLADFVLQTTGYTVSSTLHIVLHSVQTLQASNSTPNSAPAQLKDAVCPIDQCDCNCGLQALAASSMPCVHMSFHHMPYPGSTAHPSLAACCLCHLTPPIVQYLHGICLCISHRDAHGCSGGVLCLMYSYRRTPCGCWKSSTGVVPVQHHRLSSCSIT